MTANVVSPVSPETRRRIRAAIFGNPAVALAKRTTQAGGPLHAMPIETVGVGSRAGLPFECLSTDLYSGCLPAGAICYGNCQQALMIFGRGYDFGDRKLNSFDPDRIRSDLAALDPQQRWIRQGWSSDVSFGDEAWNRVAALASLVAESGRHFVLLTKVFKAPPREALAGLAAARAEVRVSISAFDEDGPLTQRVKFLEAYRAAGGLAVPYLMSLEFAKPELRTRQLEILEWITENDYPGGEHPLRLERTNALSEWLDPDRAFAHPKFTSQTWAGRLYPMELPLPAPPSLRPSYCGFGSGFASQVDWEQVSRAFDHGEPTFREISNGTADLSHPNLYRHGTIHLVPAHTSNTDEVTVAPELATALSQALPDQPSDSGMIASLRREIETTVARRGWIVVRGIPYDPDDRTLLLIGSWLGHPTRYLDQPLVRSLEPAPGFPETAYYAGAGNVELHTDKAFVEQPPHFVVMHCARSDQRGGGDVLLSKASHSFDRLPVQLQDALRTTPVEVAIPAHIDRDAAPAHAFVAESMGAQLRIRLRADLLRKPSPDDFREALNQFCALARESAERVALAPGTLLVIDNWAALHGRTALQSGMDSTRLCHRLLIA